MTTSGTYNFQYQFNIDLIIREAFEKCGIIGDVLTPLQTNSAQTSLNLMFSNWVNRGLNLWAVDQQMIQLYPQQATYTFPVGTIDIINNECQVANITRVLNGTAFSSAGGNANNAFDGNLTTACTQTSPNGYISYNYGTGNNISINYVGITANTTNTWSLAVEYSFDNVTWYNAFTGLLSTAVSYTTQPQTYIAGSTVWLVPTIPPNAQVWRIRETGGGTLDITELYFDIPNFSKGISRLSRYEYILISNKVEYSDVSSFVVNRQIQPSVTFWPTPSANTDYLFCIYNRKRMIQDVNDFISNVDNPQRFYEALISGLACRLAMKFAPDKYDGLNTLAEADYSAAARDDTERVPLRIQPDLSSYGY